MREMENYTIGRANEEQYEHLMTQLNRSFSFPESGEGFLGLLPKLYKREYRPWEKNICLFENGRIAAAVGIYPDKYHIGGETMTVGGIGNVAVCPEDRKKGYMKLLMNASVEEMIREGVDFAVLHGQRQRYQYFGFENIGFAHTFYLTDSSLRHTVPPSTVPLSVRPLETADQAALDIVCALYDKRPNRFIRPRAQFIDILHSWNAKPYLLEDGKTPVGYFVLNDNGDRVCELVLSDSVPPVRALLACVQTVGASRCAFTVPSSDTTLCDLLADICDWREENEGAQVNIFNYQKVLTAFMRAHAEETRLPDLQMTCLIHGIAGDERLSVTVRDGRVDVRPVVGDCQIELSHIEAENFFFAPYSPTRRRFGSVGGVFPSPFFILSQDCV